MLVALPTAAATWPAAVCSTARLPSPAPSSGWRGCLRCVDPLDAVDYAFRVQEITARMQLLHRFHLTQCGSVRFPRPSGSCSPPCYSIMHLPSVNRCQNNLGADWHVGTLISHHRLNADCRDIRQLALRGRGRSALLAQQCAGLRTAGPVLAGA